MAAVILEVDERNKLIIHVRKKDLRSSGKEALVVYPGFHYKQNKNDVKVAPNSFQHFPRRRF